MRLRAWLIAGLLFGSGFCALVYQVGWLREFRLIFGASTAASAAVLAIFIGGLGVGGLLLGPRADAHPRPFLFYAQLETFVALSAAVTPFLLSAVRFLYLASGGSSVLGTPVATVGRLVLSAMVLSLPTVAMGGTLPAAARAATRENDLRRQDVAALYALNTLGAVCGCGVATFWMLETFGTRSTLWLAAAFNVLVAMLARQLERSLATARSGAATEPGARADLAGSDAERAAPLRFLLLASGGVGFAFFLMELVWYRMLAPLLGGSAFSFGLILAVALAGIGIGGLLYALVSDQRRASLPGFAWSCLLEAGCLAATFALGDRLAILALALVPLSNVGFAARVVGWSLTTLVVVLPAAVVAGYQFPLLIALFGRGRHHVGQQIGWAYAANTVGAIVGSLAGGFGLLPWISAIGTWRLVSALLVALGLAAAVVSALQAPRPRRTLAAHAGLALGVITLLIATGPTAIWRHTGIGAGRARADALSSANQFRTWVNTTERDVIWQADGIESSVALVRGHSGLTFFMNGKSDGSAREDSGTQVMLGLLGALANPSATTALVVGLGTGSSAGWLAAIPSLDKVDVVEMEPRIVDVARAFSAVNHDVLANPKVHLTIGDAREILQTTREGYDLIVSEPSNPFRAGIASLFTVEYYRSAASRLHDDGTFIQWLQVYEVDAPTVRTAYKTLAQVFPYIETWHTDVGDVGLVASKRPRVHNIAALSRRIADEPFKSALARVWGATSVESLFGRHLAGPGFARLVATMPGVDINTDDRNIIEFSVARSVGRNLVLIPDIDEAARASGVSRPAVDDEAAVRWAEVDTAAISHGVTLSDFHEPRMNGSAADRARRGALVAYYQRGDLAAARQLWGSQADEPRDLNELVMLADLAVSAGDAAAAECHIEQLRAYQTGEADVLLATLRLGQQRLPEAAEAVAAALMRFRTDPWPRVRLKERAFQLADVLAAASPALGRKLFDAMAEPLAVDAIDDIRTATRAAMTRRIDFPGLCNGAVSALEPHVPWTEPFLRLRRDCYNVTRDARLARATDDLAEYLRNAGPTIIPR